MLNNNLFLVETEKNHILIIYKYLHVNIYIFKYMPIYKYKKI